MVLHRALAPHTHSEVDSQSARTENLTLRRLRTTIMTREMSAKSSAIQAVRHVLAGKIYASEAVA